MNQFIAIPVVAGTGAGAGVDISCLSPEQTVIVAGAFTGALHIEVSDDNINWGPLVDFTGPDYENFKTAVQFMRTRSSTLVGSPVVFVAGTELCTIAVSLPVPVGNGVGAAVDVSGLGLLKTIIVAGTFNASVGIEISENGTDFVDLTRFSQPDRENLDGVARFVRVSVSGYVNGVPIVFVGGSRPDDSATNIFSPPFEVKTTTIYARTTGSNTLGNGTLAKPYRTFQRAIQDVPHDIPPGQRFVVDITGIGTETLPASYQMPSIHGTFQIGFASAGPFLLYEALTILAIPTPVPMIPATDATILAADIVSTTFNADTGLTTIKVGAARAGWAAGALKGKFLLGDVDAGANCAIWDSNSTEVFLCNNSVGGSLNFTIVETTATLEGPAPLDGDQIASFEVVDCTSIGFKGIKFRCTDPAYVGLQISKAVQPSMEICDTDGIEGFGIAEQLIFFSSVCRDKLIDCEGVTFTPRRSYFTAIPDFFLSGHWQVFRACVFDACPGSIEPFVFAVNIGGLNSSGWEWFDCLFMGCGSPNTFNLKAASNYSFLNTKIQGAPGDAIHAEGPMMVTLENVTGGTGAVGDPANGGLGVRAEDGAFVRVLDDLTLVTGLGGDMQVGALPARTWADFRANPILKNEYDIASPPLGDVVVGVGGPVLLASNTAPISITTTAAHGLFSGARVTISGALGNTDANGTWTIVVTSPTTFDLVGSDGTGSGAYVPGTAIVETHTGGTSGSRLFQRP